MRKSKIKNLKSKVLRIGNCLSTPLGILSLSKGKLEIGNSRVSELGFTLVELLAVIMIIGVVGGVVGAILISSLVGTNKTNALDSIRQNGNYALLQISKEVEFSRNFYGVSTNGTDYVTDCTTPAVSPTPTSTQYTYLKIMSPESEEVIFSCGSLTISSNGVPLIDASTIKTDSCFFTCSQDSIVLPPTVGINFTLSQSKVGNFTENRTTIPFSTSVTLRNLNR